MDTQLGDLYNVICDTEIEISHDLAQRVLLDQTLLITISDICGELDCILALAHGAVEHKLVKPTITTDNVIDIKAGRHILQELTVASFVRNDTSIAGGLNHRPNMMILMGPNFSGKSVYLKQVALIVYMAQVGCFVPAESATIGLTDKILTRISTRESVSLAASTFMIDLQQMSRALSHCTPRSLLVIDEFGKGTDPCDGAGIAGAVFDHLLSLGDMAPKVLACTHLYEIFQDGRFIPRNNLMLAHMQVLVDQDQHQNGKSATGEAIHLYQIRVGLSTLSYGAECAARNGVPRPIVERATTLSSLLIGGGDLVAACVTSLDQDLAKIKHSEGLARRFLMQRFDESSEFSTRDGLRAMGPVRY